MEKVKAEKSENACKIVKEEKTENARKAGVSCVFAGTFDPLTAGHENVVGKCLALYDRVFVVIGENPLKAPAFSLEERAAVLRAVYGNVARVCITDYTAHKDDYAGFLRDNGVTVYVRGVRNETDKAYEDEYAAKNARLYPFIKTVYLAPDEKYRAVSSSLVRKKLKNGEDLTGLLSENALKTVTALLEKRKREKQAETKA